MQGLMTWLKEAFTENLALKAMALIFSFGFFGYIHGQEDVQQRTVPVSVISLPPESGDRELMTRIPPNIHVTLRGSTRAMTELIQEGVPPVEIDLREGYPTEISFTRDMFLLPRDLELVVVDPPRLELEWEKVVTRQVPLQASITGQVAEGHIVKGEPKIDPEKVTVRGPVSKVEVMQFARLAPFIVTGLTEGTWMRRIAIDPPPPQVSYLGSPAATVTVEVAQRKSEKLFANRPVEVIGPGRATVVPRTVDVMVVGPPEVVRSLREEQIVPQADLASSNKWKEGDEDGGSATVPVTVHLGKAQAETQPPVVTVKW